MTEASRNGFQKEAVFKGLTLSKGIAIARVCRFNEKRHSNMEIYKVSGEGLDREVSRVRRAAEVAAERVEAIRKETEEKIGKAEAEIFSAHRMILEDHSLLQAIEDLIRKKGTNAEAAVMAVLDSYEARMRQIDDEYLQDRAGDFVEIKNRLLDILRNTNPAFQCVDLAHCQRGKNRIVVSTELTPGMTVELDTSHTMGFVTERGGSNSHAAILARALGIPAVSGIPDIHAEIACGAEIAINGDEGEVILWPSEKTVARLKKMAGGIVRVPSAVDPVDGFAVMANINLASELDEATSMRADGIGLYRTEYEFITAGRFLSEDEQYERYSQVVKGMQGKPVIFRLFDAGGDKPLPFLESGHEENPALGYRGGRLLLGHEKLFATQARAMARASVHGEVLAMYPMVVDLEQFILLRSLFLESAAGIDSNVKHGVMFEVPSACLDARKIMREADFASIGTNDLIQYLFAVDRNNALVAYDYSPKRALLWKMIGSMVRACQSQGKSISVCGEIAGDPKYIKKLMKKGVRAVSVSPRLVTGARVAALEAIEKAK